MSQIPLQVKKRIHEADARILRLEGLLQKWLSYCAQAGAEHELDELNPVHALIIETRAAVKSN